MLDARTKQTIDNACDVLVGKVPSPQAQVEIITTALIYKFMDDMDLDGLELSDHRTFFVGDLEPYAFSAVVNTKGNQERMNLYLTGLEKLQTAPSVPALFRSIFKDTLIPFRDPATFGLFLKEIADLRYDDSEKLGDAFEYLLNRMGTQGNAGQFRTPRHIIDFIVDVVNPTKTDTILDPACGTAGFLISAYKHITSGNTLTPSELKTVAKNITGLDIDPTMVKLALVNLYLHRFQQPKVHEYDTLSDDARWGDKYDVILANPPFMTPKGGIIPHSRFAIKANRSEVLFVDYFMEHLTLRGRAGFVVPEGIIFNAQTAYKSLRKMMVDDYLYAVISLPPGVFNPYAGVKTSILLFDRDFAKKSKNVLFVCVDNDGYSLGAQRNKIDKNDLPETLKIINEFRAGGDVSQYERATVITKELILAEPNYDLRAAAYMTKETVVCKYEMVELGGVCDIKTGKKDVNQGNPDGIYPFFTCAREISHSDTFSFDTEALLIAGNGDVGTVKYFKGKFEAYQRTYVLTDFKRVLPKYLFAVLQTTLKPYIKNHTLGNTIPYIKLGTLKNYQIPLPPLDVQQQIVDEIENKQSVIDRAREIIKKLEREGFYFASLLDGIDYKEVKLGDLEASKDILFLRGQGISKQDFDDNGDKKCIHYGDLYTLYSPLIKNIVRRTKVDGKVKSVAGDVLVPATTTADAMGIAIGRSLNESGVIIGGDINIIRTQNKLILADYLSYVLNFCIKTDLAKCAKGVNIMHLSNADIRQLAIPLPSIEDQRRIIEILDVEREIIETNKRLIGLMRGKINRVIDRIYRCELGSNAKTTP